MGPETGSAAEAELACGSGSKKVRTGSSSAQYRAENGTSRASVAPTPVHRAPTRAVVPEPLLACTVRMISIHWLVRLLADAPATAGCRCVCFSIACRWNNSINALLHNQKGV